MRVVRAVLWFVVGLLLVSWAMFAHAGYALMSPPPGVVQSAGSITGKGLFTVVNGGFNASGVVQVGGKAVTVPAAWRMASNAGQFAASAMRFNPALFVGTAALTWAISEGFFIGDDGQWQTEELEAGWKAQPIYEGFGALSGADQCAHFGTYEQGKVFDPNAYTGYGGTAYRMTHIVLQPGPEELGSCPGNASTGWMNSAICFAYGTQSGYYWTVQQCPGYGEPGINQRPPTEAEWEGFGASPWPDSAIQSVMAQAPLPLEAPQVSPFSEPLADPYIDPVTGLPVQRVVHVQGAPTPESPLRLQVQEVIQPMTSADPETAEPDPNLSVEQPPFELPLFCDWAGVLCDFADWVKDGWAPPDDLDVPEVEQDEVEVVDYFPSDGVCPQPQVLSLIGQNFELSYGPVCDFAAGIRPLVLASGALAAGLILVGGLRRG